MYWYTFNTCTLVEQQRSRHAIDTQIEDDNGGRMRKSTTIQTEPCVWFKDFSYIYILCMKHMCIYIWDCRDRQCQYDDGDQMYYIIWLLLLLFIFYISASISVVCFSYLYFYLCMFIAISLIFFQVADIVVMMMTMATNSDIYIIYICRKGEQKLNLMRRESESKTEIEREKKKKQQIIQCVILFNWFTWTMCEKLPMPKK